MRDTSPAKVDGENAALVVVGAVVVPGKREARSTVTAARLKVLCLVRLLVFPVPKTKLNTVVPANCTV